MRLLEAAGYADVGKTNLHEFAYGVTSMNPHYGWVPNPVRARADRGRIERRLGGGARGGARGRGARHGQRRLDPDPRRVLRHRRLQADVRARLARGLLAARAELRPRRADGADRRRLRRDAGSARAGARAGAAAGPSATFASRWRGSSDASDGIRGASRTAAAHFPNRERIDFPRGRGNLKVFMREIAEVHETLFAEHAEAYGADVARKIRECLAVTDAEFARGRARPRSYRDEAAALLDGFDLLLTPTQGFVAPTYEDAADDSLRGTITSFTNPFNALGWPALALPCGTAEHGLPASIQLVGRPGEDAVVLAAGLALEAQVSRLRSLELPETSRESCSSPVPPPSLALSLLLVSRSRRGDARRTSASLAAPTSLHGFLLRADEPSPTPSAERRVRLAARDGREPLRVPLANVAASAPNAVWWSGETTVPRCRCAHRAARGSPATPYSLYAQVRGIGTDGSKGPWSKPFGFNMRWSTTPAQEDAPRRADSLDDGRRRDRVRGVVPRRGTAGPHEHERRRRARVLGLDAAPEAGALARPRGARDLQQRVERRAGSFARPVEPGLHVGTSPLPRQAPRRRRERVGHRLDEPRGRCPPFDAGLRLRRRHEPGRRDRRRLSRLRRDRQGLREHRLPRRRRLEPCVRTARLRRPVLGRRLLHVADDEPLGAISGTTTGRPAVTTGRSWPSPTRIPPTAAASSTCRRMLARPLASGTFRRTSDPAVASKTHVPYAAGLSPAAGCLAATAQRPRFYGTPLVSWQPALAATSYEVQWSKTVVVRAGGGTSQDARDVCDVAAHARHMVVPGARPQPRCRRRVYGDELVEAYPRRSSSRSRRSRSFGKLLGLTRPKALKLRARVRR